MYRRAYAIALRPDLPDAVLAEFVEVLRRAPEHMPTMRSSSVSVEVTDHTPWQLVWDNAFDDEQGYRDYLVHPYHGNVIDHFMYREHPSNVVREIFCLRWDESAPLPAGVSPEVGP